MRTIFLTSLCCVSLIAVALDLLIIRPTSTPGGVDVHVAMVRGMDVPKTVKIEGTTIVGFSCVDVPNGVACYIASR
jgi:hypothetical protein